MPSVSFDTEGSHRSFLSWQTDDPLQLRDGGVQPGGQVDGGHADFAGCAVRWSGDRHQPGFGLLRDVVARPLCAGSLWGKWEVR